MISRAVVTVAALATIAMPSLAQEARPNCLTGPTRRDDAFQNYIVENRCGVAITIVVTKEVEGKKDIITWSIPPCRWSSIQGSVNWKFDLGSPEWKGVADGKYCEGRPLKKAGE